MTSSDTDHASKKKKINIRKKKTQNNNSKSLSMVFFFFFFFKHVPFSRGHLGRKARLRDACRVARVVGWPCDRSPASGERACIFRPRSRQGTGRKTCCCNGPRGRPRGFAPRISTNVGDARRRRCSPARFATFFFFNNRSYFLFFFFLG